MVEEESVLDEALDAVMEFVGDEDVQRGAGYLVLGGIVIGCLIGVYILIQMYWQYILIAILIIAYIMYNNKPTSYCADCGNSLGSGPPSRPCSRCRCNRWTYSDPGVGMTVKNR
ncbi:MAG: hypothetical protein QF454_01655 [Candidatus Thalassarchaeaceae archaeon]|jgi:hypothetical protein|nr:hypothetical protein [Candidatus Thalassarchaeaceae archaeon]